MLERLKVMFLSRRILLLFLLTKNKKIRVCGRQMQSFISKFKINVSFPGPISFNVRIEKTYITLLYFFPLGLMDQSRKRRLNSKRAGLSQCKVSRAEEPENVSDMRGSCRRFTKIRSSSPQSDSNASKTSMLHHVVFIIYIQNECKMYILLICISATA